MPAAHRCLAFRRPGAGTVRAHCSLEMEQAFLLDHIGEPVPRQAPSLQFARQGSRLGAGRFLDAHPRLHFLVEPGVLFVGHILPGGLSSAATGPPSDFALLIHGCGPNLGAAVLVRRIGAALSCADQYCPSAGWRTAQGLT